MSTPERKAKDKLVRMMKKYGCYWTTNTTHGMGKSGAPDYTGCHNGRYFGVEVKADTKVTKLQQQNLDQIVEAGGSAFVVRKTSAGDESGYDEFEAFLKGGNDA